LDHYPKTLYFLDVVGNGEVWTFRQEVDFMTLKIVGMGNRIKFSGIGAPGNDEEPIQESMAMQGRLLGDEVGGIGVIGELSK